MKKIFFILMIGLNYLPGMAQEKITREQARTICAQGMAAFTKAIAPVYKPGNSYEQFQAALCGNIQPATEGANQLKIAYAFLVQSASTDAIIKNYQGKEVAASLNYLLTLHKKGIESDGSELFGGKTGSANSSFAKNAEGGCKWYQFSCLVQAALNWVVMQWVTITGIAGAFDLPIFAP
ncbi:MAG: hypothetical protein QM737_13975 [Ferruginibacter sp.]